MHKRNFTLEGVGGEENKIDHGHYELYGGVRLERWGEDSFESVPNTRWR
jgi:hypothetical protein